MASKRLAKKREKQKLMQQKLQADRQPKITKEIKIQKKQEEKEAEPVKELKVEIKKADAVVVKTQGKKGTTVKKPNIYIQYQQNEVEEQAIINKVKEAWKAAGNKVKDLEEMTIYIKPEEGKAYYIINQSVNGEIELF